MPAPTSEAIPQASSSMPPAASAGPPPMGMPMDYRYPPYYDPYYDMRYDPYGPPPPMPPPHGPPPPGGHGPPSHGGPHGAPHGAPHGPPHAHGPPRGYSPEYRSRYAYPPPPRTSPRMYRGFNGPPPQGPPSHQGQYQASGGASISSASAMSTTTAPKHPPEHGKEQDGDVKMENKENCGGNANQNKTPSKGGYMEHAVDNIIAAAEQIEKRDSPPNCPSNKQLAKQQSDGATSSSNASVATDAATHGREPAPSTNPPPSVASTQDMQSSPPPPSFHRYSTSPVMNPPSLPPHPVGPPSHGPPPAHAHGPPPGPPPPNHGPPPPGHGPPPPPGPPSYNYDPYYDYRYDGYYDYYPPPPPYDHPPHCQCHYCTSPAKRRAPSYPPPSWDYDYHHLELSSPDEPPKKRRREKRLYHTYSNATKHKANARNLNPAEEEAEMNRVTRLAAEVEGDSSLYRAVLLHMALEKESPKKKPSFDVEEVLEGFAEPSGGGSMAGSPHSMELGSPHGFGVENRGTIGEGFYWKDYPLLENVLRKSMDEYYEMSENCPQSKQQQQFNNRLVSKVYHTAISHGYTFDPIAFTGGSTPLTERKKSKQKDPNHEFEPLPPGFNYKKLRDRIRCYYKTHVQNSKKRLTTMLKNPTKPKNREILLRVVAEVKSEGYVGPLSGTWDGPKTKKTKSKVTPSVTFSSDDDFGLGSFSADSTSPTEAQRVLVESSQVAASPFRRMEHAQILSSMRDQV